MLIKAIKVLSHWRDDSTVWSWKKIRNELNDLSKESPVVRKERLDLL